MISIDSVSLMRNIRKELSQVYSKMSHEELLKISEKYPGIPWTATKSIQQTKSKKTHKDKSL